MSWDDEAETWDDDPVVRTYSRAAYRSLVEHLSGAGVSLEGAAVLDFGCGTGLLTAAMAAHAREVVGYDLSAAMTAKLAAKNLENVRALSGHLAEHDLGLFDVITCSSVCAFLPDYPATVVELTRLLAPGGTFVQWDWELDPSAEEAFGLARGDIERALREAGLQDVAVRVGFREPVEDMLMAPLMGTGRRSRDAAEPTGT